MFPATPEDIVRNVKLNQPVRNVSMQSLQVLLSMIMVYVKFVVWDVQNVLTKMVFKNVLSVNPITTKIMEHANLASLLMIPGYSVIVPLNFYNAKEDITWLMGNVLKIWGTV